MQWLPCESKVVDTTPAQGRPVLYAEEVAFVRPVGDITQRQRPPANSAEEVASVSLVVNPICVSVSRRRRRRRTRQQSVMPASSTTPAPPLEDIHVVNITGAGSSSHPLQVPSPPYYASDITQFPEILRYDMPHALKWGEIEQLCAVVQAPAL